LGGDKKVGEMSNYLKLEKTLKSEHQTLIPRVLEFTIDGIDYKLELNEIKVIPIKNELVLKYRLVKK